jgi:hypothetical protein
VDDGSSKFDGKRAQNKESESPPDGDRPEQAASRKPERAVRSDDHGEWKRRRGQRSDYKRFRTVLADHALERLEAASAGDSGNALLPKATRDEIKQQHPERGAASRGKGVDQVKIVMPRRQDYYQKVVSEWQKQKRGVEDSQNKRPEATQM